MKTSLVIIRGNSASGKTTIANKVRDSFEQGEALLISQDEVRLRMLNVKDREGGLVPDLIEIIALFGKINVPTVMIEGILGTNIYQKMFVRLVDAFDGNVHAYYLDIPFEETLRRHQTKPESILWGEEEMKRWWLEKDYLGIENEVIFNSDDSQEEIIQKIITDITAAPSV